MEREAAVRPPLFFLSACEVDIWMRICLLTYFNPSDISANSFTDYFCESKQISLLIRSITNHTMKKYPKIGIRYYLDFQNRRADALKALWNIVDWDVVESRY